MYVHVHSWLATLLKIPPHYRIQSMPCRVRHTQAKATAEPVATDPDPLDYAITHNLTPFVSMQNQYNLIYREEEREMLPTLKVWVVH